jgi:hypothetical protein
MGLTRKRDLKMRFEVKALCQSLHAHIDYKFCTNCQKIAEWTRRMLAENMAAQGRAEA